MSGTTAPQGPDLYAQARRAALSLGVAPQRLAQIDALSLALKDQGLAATDPRVELYLRPLIDRPSGRMSALVSDDDEPAGPVPAPPLLPGQFTSLGERLVIAGLAVQVCLPFALAILQLSTSAPPVGPDSPPPGTTAQPIPDAGVAQEIAVYLLTWPVAAAVVAILALVAAWQFTWPVVDLWLGERRKQRLRHNPLPDRGELVEVATRQGRARLFDDPALRAAMRMLRRHRAVTSTRIDVRASIRATVAKGTLAQLRFAKRRLSPDYVLLSERERPNDHLPQVASAWRDRMHEAGIDCEHYEFFSTPLRLQQLTDGRSRPVRRPIEAVEAVLSRHHGGTAIVLLEAFDALGPDSLPPQWLTDMRRFVTPHLMNPREPRHWSVAEARLNELGLPSFAASAEGTGVFAARIDQTINQGREVAPPRLTAPGQPDLAAWLDSYRAMLLTPEAPEPAQIATLLDVLERWLDSEAYTWLRALALFPWINSGFTFFSGCVLYDTPIITHHRYLALARLPWLRTAYMPPWLRLALVETLSPEACARAAATAAAFLDPPPGGIARDLQLIELRRAVEDKAARQRLAKRLEHGANPLPRDRLLIEVLKGTPPDKLAVALDQDIAPAPPPWWRRAWVHGAVFASVATLALFSVAPGIWPQKPGLVQIDTRPDPNPAPASVEPLATDSALTPEIIASTAAPTPQPTSSTALPPPSPITGSRAVLSIHYAQTSQQTQAGALAAALDGIKLGKVRLSAAPIQYRGADSPSVSQLRCFDPSGCALAGLLQPLLTKRGVAARIVLFRQADLKAGNSAPPNALELWLGGSAPPFPAGDFTVFFDWNGYSLTPESAAVLDKVALRYREGRWKIRLEGRTDAASSSAYAMGLADRYARSAADYLVKMGVDSADISTISYGKERPAIPAAGREPLNRRVDVFLEQK